MASALFALALTHPLAASGAMPVYLSVSSPDHPHTWAAGANQLSKKLRWDGARNQLVADVKYSTADYADSVNPATTDDHTLAFPNVRLAKDGNDLRATDRSGITATIGRLQEGLFGKEVVLNKGVHLNVHRVDGAIHAALVYNSLAAR
jgi:hypothetical protein